MFDDLICEKEEWVIEHQHICKRCSYVIQDENIEYFHEKIRGHYILMHSEEPPTTVDITIIPVRKK